MENRLNYVSKRKQNLGLNGLIPADKCGIDIVGNNKWMTIIQNASVK